MEKFLRDWRQDALNKHQYESAIFIGDKLLALTNNDKDAFWLAQVHFSTGNYTHARSFLTRQDLINNNPSCKYLAAHCFVKEGKFDEALNILGDKNPTHLITAPGSARRKLQHLDGSARNGLFKQTKAEKKLERADRSEERDKENISNIRFEAAMCYLRGVCYAKQNAFDRAKECYKDAVRIDVQCFEAFDQLMKNSLMSPQEEWKFLECLNFDIISVGDSSSSQEAAEFTRMLYTTRLSKYSHPEEFTTATETLSTHYNLSENPDILLAKAELLFTQCRFKEALALTTSILAKDKYNFNTFPIHLACLHELNEKNALFLLSHDLADRHPSEPCAWLAVGVYYLTINRIAEARRFFSKASMMDPHYGPAWIGFAHTFAAEGEHDQAISAYSTAARLFQGTHLPQLFLGMQNLQLNNMPLAHEYLNTAYDLCSTDPLLLNELGVVFYHEDHRSEAIKIFKLALTLAEQINSDPRAWIATRANLGHAYRREYQYELALEQFEEVLRQGGKDAGMFCAKGLVLLEMGDCWGAVVALHEALAVSPQDPIATELLSKALEASEIVAIMGQSEEDEFERKIGANKRDAVTARRTRRANKDQVDDEERRMTGLGGDSMMLDSDED
ncbi:cell division cycle protein-like protein [Patellaria atrata CBS 101060]|uniref:Cell division cycle protein-like protein n=1 Tax=Patellaria atrata CBS 101060 TaxID=1346257 RepID=A0A9P4SEG3_9PEZI|nr:cell division cycle protein-like protein [Patellaria atrata CBS 101060]